MIFMKNLLITLSILTLCKIGFGQNFVEVLQANELNWYGIDFTKAKMIGSIGFTNPDVICNRYIHNKWNGIVFSEPEKYDISKFIGGKEINIHLDFILERNSQVTTDNLIINEDYEIEPDKILELLKEYPVKGGVGLVFIVESFNKLNDTANIWVTFFDNNSKKILKTQKYSSEPGGFGVLNYWLGGVYNTCKQLKKDYKKWERDLS